MVVCPIIHSQLHYTCQHENGGWLELSGRLLRSKHLSRQTDRYFLIQITVWQVCESMLYFLIVHKYSKSFMLRVMAMVISQPFCHITVKNNFLVVACGLVYY